MIRRVVALKLSKRTSPSLWNLTVDLVARFSQTFFTRASFHRGEEVWLKSFNFKSFFALKIVILYFKTQLSAWNRSIFFLQDLSSRFELAYSALDSVKPVALVGNTVLSISGENQRRHNYERGNGNDVFSAPCLPKFQGLPKNISSWKCNFFTMSVNGSIFEPWHRKKDDI